MLWASGWTWLIGAGVLGIAETLLPGFILLGFGLGALVVSVLLFLGLIGTLPVVLLVWAVASGLAWGLLKRLFTRPGSRPKIWRTDINDN